MSRREMVCADELTCVPVGKSAFVDLYKLSKVSYAVYGPAKVLCHVWQGDAIPCLPYGDFDGRLRGFDKLEFYNSGKDALWLRVSVTELEENEAGRLDFTELTIQQPGGDEDRLSVAQLVKKEMGRYGVEYDGPGDADSFLDGDDDDGDLSSRYEETEMLEEFPHVPPEITAPEPGEGGSQEPTPEPEEGATVTVEDS